MNELQKLAMVAEGKKLNRLIKEALPDKSIDETDDNVSSHIKTLISNIHQSSNSEAKLTVLARGIEKNTVESYGEEINNLIKELFESVSESDGLESQLDEESYKQLLKRIKTKLKNKVTKKIKTDSEGLESDNNKKALAATKLQLYNFFIYEIYKAMNPHRIAGETTKENFEYNVILHDFGNAAKYEGGSEREMRGYSKEYLEKLQKKRKQFTRIKKLTK